MTSIRTDDPTDLAGVVAELAQLVRRLAHATWMEQTARRARQLETLADVFSERP